MKNIMNQLTELNNKMNAVNKKLYECIDNNNTIQFYVFYKGHLQFKKQLEKISKCGYKYPEIESFAVKCNLA